ncbi:Gfo/Idh/MocA family oxidoreductase [Hamadaea sp. NPDC051192]|uniref:Gfo/Idh/MocA family protein n=1 Tax=Hamadaea sp. NPDC051192 TaxID=3154940 RepID=UPI00341F3B53
MIHVRVGIAGYGVAGRIFHGGLLRQTPTAEVVAVVTRNPDRRAEVAADFPAAAVRDDLTGMLTDDRPDLVVLATPTRFHADAALECFASGVPVVVDKPMALDAEQAQQMVTAAEVAGVAFTLFQNRRWDSDFLTVRRLIAEHELGEVLRFESRFERWRPEPSPGKWREDLPPEEGGGSLLDLGSHLVDQAVQLLGPVHSVYAEVASRRGTAADDDVFLALTHLGDVHSHLSCGNLAGAPGPRMRVLGSGGAFVVHDLDGQEEALRTGRRVVTPVGRLCRGAEFTPVEPTPGDWASYYPAVFAAVESGGPMPVDPLDGVHTMEVLDAARASAASGSTVSL